MYPPVAIPGTPVASRSPCTTTLLPVPEIQIMPKIYVSLAANDEHEMSISRVPTVCADKRYATHVASRRQSQSQRA